jgi:hypothetical protein
VAHPFATVIPLDDPNTHADKMENLPGKETRKSGRLAA